MFSRSTRYALLLMASAAAAPAMAHAQDEAGSAVEEIVVTARRVEESLQTTPVAVTALSTAQLERAQIDDQAGLQRATPGLVIATGSPGNGGFAFVSIRGQGNFNPGVANDPAVGTYIDGVYIPRPSQGISKLIDLQRIEVLRGPQGTLFGRNTTGGAINVLTNDPAGDFSATVQGQVGNYDAWEAGGILNVPIVGSELGLRLVYDHREHSGYYDQVLLNNRDANDEKSDFLSGKLRFAPEGRNFNVVIAGDYNKITDSGQAVALRAVDPTALAPSSLLGAPLAPLYAPLTAFVKTKDNWDSVYGTGFAAGTPLLGGSLPYNYVKAYGGSATVNVDLGGVQIKSISGFRYSDSIGQQDLDGTPLPLLTSISGFSSKQLSQELQVSGDFGDRLSYITGLYYSYETGREVSQFQTFGFLAPTAGVNDADVKNISTGAFGQAYYKVTDRITLTGGLRWAWDKRTVVLRNLRNEVAPPFAALPPFGLTNCTVLPDTAGICAQTRTAKFDYPAYTIGVDFEASDDLFLYAKTSRASKAGGWNLRQGSAETTPAFDPETAKDVEGGFKYTAPNRRFRLNGAAFYTWTSDVQRNATALVNGLTTQYILNAGKTRIYGAELEATVIPVERLELTGNVALLRGHYKNGTFVDQPIAGVFVDHSDEPLPQLPKVQYSLGATYTIPMDAGLLTLHANYAYVSAQYGTGLTTPIPVAPAALQAQQALQNSYSRWPGYGLVNARVTFDVGDTGLQFEAFGRNIFDKKYISNTFAGVYSALGTAVAYLGDPATYGVGVRYRFGGR